MDTKWKKGKAFLSFASFVVGVSLVLSCGLPLLADVATAEGRLKLKDVSQGTLENTSTFRAYLSDCMNRFISMAAGGPVYGGGYYEYGGYDIAFSGEIAMDTTMVGTAAKEYPIDLDQEDKVSQQQKELWKRQAQALNERLQADKNILYRISYDGKLLYSNTDDPLTELPTGCSFLLSFDGTKCTGYQHYQFIELYGAGYYTDDPEQWYLPGYTNFPAGETASKARVAIATRSVRAPFLYGIYTSTWAERQDNQLYWIEQDWQADQQTVLGRIVGTIVGLILVAAYAIYREEKAQADRAVARVTSKAWFEVKLALLLAAAVFALFPFTEGMGKLIQEVAYTSAEEVTYVMPWFLAGYWGEILARPPALLAAFWVCYLFINDLRYGNRPWRHGLLGMLRAKDLKRPIQKRLSRNAAVAPLAGAILILVAAPVLLRILENRFLGRFSDWNDFLFAFLVAFILMTIWVIRACLRTQALARDFGLLADQIAAIRDGDLTSPLPLPEDSDLRQAAEELADIQHGMKEAVAQQTRSERMKVELVTNVSHDIKTPLTSIISYTELLKQEALEPPAGEYVEILAQKAERLRAMVLDVFEVSKAASGNLPVKLERLDLDKLIRQTLADMAEAIEAAPVTLREALSDTPVFIVADGQRLYRVFQNLIQNALKYALEGSRVYLSLEVAEGKAVASLKNTSKAELPAGMDFTERFARGDVSRTDGGSGLGLAIADSFTRACGGELTVEPIADLFVATVTFPLAEEKDCEAEENPV